MKLAPRRYGPFHITSKVSNVAYRLKIPEKWKIHNVFHVSLLTPYKETEKHGPNFLEPPPDLIDGKEEWEVEEILGDRQYQHKKQYLVRWKGYAPAHDSWVDESELHAHDLIETYKRKNTKKILTKLAQLTTADIPQPAQTPHHQSQIAEIPQDVTIRNHAYQKLFFSSSLAPACSSLYLRPAYTTSTLLNCTSRNSRASSGTVTGLEAVWRTGAHVSRATGQESIC
jgi:Chromo (CHRromatin Organisation MOdifier) domain